MILNMGDTSDIIKRKNQLMTRHLIIAFLFLSSLAFHAEAQEVLTLKRARELSLNQNQDLRIATMQVEKASQQRAAARTLRLPSFSASGTGVYQDKDFEMEMTLPTKVPDLHTGELVPNFLLNPVTKEPVIGHDGNPVFGMYAWLPLNISLSGAYLMGVTMEQPLYSGGKISAGNNMADIGMSMAHESVSLQKTNAIMAADNAYWIYISVMQQVKLAQLAIEMLEELVQIAADSHEVGMVSRNDVLKAQVEYNNARLNLQKAQNGLELSRMELCRVTGLPFDTRIVAADTIIKTSQPISPGIDEINTRQRPEYRLLEYNTRMSEQNIKMVRSEYLPTAGFQAGYNHIGGLEFGDTEFSNTSINIIGSVRIPLFQWGQGVRKINAARIEKEVNELELEKIDQLMQLEAHKARLNLQLAWERIQMNEDALDQAIENLRVSRDNYELGMETITDLLMAQTHWQKAYSELIESRADFRLKETQWLKATGRLHE